ncbi:MAG TPA: ABC transporter ATP-binding protein [Aquifex aeolicus]|uniref:ABC transporter ATP-binding protein n=1 Tax=Aquifex aeolicus TaxID=63363 RepID=A0A7C5LBR7_AQUAO|nr:ABC transporter ATP-binding protein [Aquifex aeolicus]
MEDLRWLLRHIRPYLPLLLLSLIGSILQSGGATGVTLLVKNVIDEVFVFKNEEELVRIVFLMLLSALAMQAGFFLSKYFVTLASEKTLRDIRLRIFRKLLYVPYTFFVRHPTGDLISRVVSDVEKIRQILVDQVPTLLREPVVGLALFGVLLYRDPFLTAFLIIAVPVMAYMVRFFGSKKGKHLRRTQESTAELTQTLSQSLQGIENLKVFSAQEKLIQAFREFNDRIYRSSVRTELYIAGNTALNYLFGYGVTAGVIFYGGFRILQGDLTPGDFISYLTALFLVQPPLLNSQKALMNLRGTLPVVRRLRDLLNMEEEPSGGVSFEGLKRDLRFEDVEVAVDGKTILRGITFSVSKGERIGIVGHTGSGKSTLVRIIPRLVDYRGSVRIDGTELREFDLKTLRERVGISTQETFLLNATVRENLLIAKPDATEEEMREALRLALCDFVERIRGGIDGLVGERGYSLSGGERQRLALARLFLKNPEIVILDEATSALDLNTEKEVLRNVQEFFAGRTMFVVAHRLSNVAICDRILVMREGSIVEEGDFRSLLGKEGEFSRIFRESGVL